MSQHLQIVVILDVTALQECHPAIDNSELGMECSKDWPMKVDHFQIDIRNFLWCRKTNFICSSLLAVYFQAVVKDLDVC